MPSPFKELKRGISLEKRSLHLNKNLYINCNLLTVHLVYCFYSFNSLIDSVQIVCIHFLVFSVFYMLQIVDVQYNRIILTSIVWRRKRTSSIFSVPLYTVRSLWIQERTKTCIPNVIDTRFISHTVHKMYAFVF